MVDLQAPYLKVALTARVSVQEHKKASVPSYNVPSCPALPYCAPRGHNFIVISYPMQIHVRLVAVLLLL